MAMAFKSDETPVAQMESFLTCSICLKMFNDPRTLSCLHSFCNSCLEAFVIKSQRDNQVHSTSRKKIIKEFNCPTCRSTFPLESKKYETETSSSQANHFIRNMLDVVSIQRRAKVAKCSTSLCENPAIARCMMCEVFMCEVCLKSHENWPALKKHTVLSISELTEGPNDNLAKFSEKSHCQKHENKALKFYCETCKVLVCRYCMDFDHAKQNHSCILAKDVTEKEKKVLKTSYEILENKLNKGREALQAVSDVKERLKENLDKAKIEVHRHKEKLLQAFALKLDIKAQDEIKELDQAYNTSYQQLVKQNAEIESYVEKLKISVALSQNLLQQGNMEDIISLQETIKETVQKLRKERPKPMKHVHDGNIQYKSRSMKDKNIKAVFADKLGEVVCSPLLVSSGALDDVSVILKDEDEYLDQMEAWLNDQCKWRLCYRATKDGWRAQDFHACCDDKGPTVTLVKVGDYKFGGYTDQNWGGKGSKKSNASFLFSLRNKDHVPPFKAHVYRNADCALYSSANLGPVFGGESFGFGHDLCIFVNSMHDARSYTNVGITYKPPEGYSYGEEPTKSLMAGSFKFMPDEIEVFY